MSFTAQTKPCCVDGCSDDRHAKYARCYFHQSELWKAKNRKQVKEDRRKRLLIQRNLNKRKKPIKVVEPKSPEYYAEQIALAKRQQAGWGGGSVGLTDLSLGEALHRKHEVI